MRNAIITTLQLLAATAAIIALCGLVMLTNPEQPMNNMESPL